jgi:hypothetical protein
LSHATELITAAAGSRQQPAAVLAFAVASRTAVSISRCAVRPSFLSARWLTPPPLVISGLQYPLLAEVRGVEWQLSLRDLCGRRHRLLDVLPCLLRLAGCTAARF